MNRPMTRRFGELAKVRDRLVGPVLLALWATACVAPDALPIRGVMAGAPGRLAQGELEVSASGLGFFNGNAELPLSAPTAYGGWGAYAASEHLSFELGGYFLPLGHGVGFGFLGGRWTGTLLTTSLGTLFADLDGTLGAGGTYCTPTSCPGSQSPRVFELGLAQGGAVGFTTGAFSFFARVRVDEGKTALGHVWVWPFAAFGVEARPARAVSLTLSAGGLTFFELGRLGEWAPFYQLQATVFLDAPWSRTPTTSATAR